MRHNIEREQAQRWASVIAALDASCLRAEERRKARLERLGADEIERRRLAHIARRAAR